jgi:hypothetical protein
MNETIATLNGNQLAYRTGCYSPDGPDSPGAEYLGRVRDAVLELVERHDNARDIMDEIHEAIDGAIPDGTHEQWQTFVDLGAYEVDTDDYGTIAVGPNGAVPALDVIGTNLAGELINELGLS